MAVQHSYLSRLLASSFPVLQIGIMYPLLAADAPTKDDSSNWRIQPKVILSEVYDDNIFATRNNTIDDYITVISPSIVANTNWDEHAIRLEAGGDIVRYQSNANEDHEHYRLSAEGRYDPAPTSNVFGGLLFRQDVEDRESPDDVFGTAPTKYYESRAYLGYFRQFDRVAMRVGATIDDLNFNDVNSTSGTINNDDRDHTSYTGGIHLGYGIRAGLETYLQAAVDNREYDQRLDDNSQMRSSTGYRLLAGTKLNSPGRYNANIFVGLIHQDYDDTALPDVRRPTFGGNLTWYASPVTTFNTYVDRTLEETTQIDASSYLYTRYGINISYQPERDLVLNTFLTHGISEYQGIDREDKLTTAGAGFKYYLGSTFFLQGDYQFRHNVSNLTPQNYDRNQVFLRLGSNLLASDRPRRRRKTDDKTTTDIVSSSNFSGFYAGGIVGHDTLYSALTGNRGPSDTVYADFGDSDASYGLFAGYGWTRNRWYTGLEAEAESADSEWSSVNTGARIFSVSRERGYGLSARLGYILRYGSLFYGRVGAVRSNFNTNYSFSGTTVEQDNASTNLRLGIGVDVPASRHVFVRAEYSYTGYDSYDVDYGTSGPDRFENAEGIFRVGLAMNFSGNLPASPTRKYTMSNLRGFYAGSQFGHGSLASEVSGLRTASSPYMAENAHEGESWGVFGGYGMLLHRVYLGVELDSDGGNQKWQFLRGTNRSYTVDKKLSYGANVRAGYVLDNGTLLYGRIGKVKTAFATRYTQGGTTVDVDNKQNGTRLGAGMELPATDSLSVRFDYTYTDYDDYDVNYGAVDNFNNSESLFRLGVLFHF